MEDKKRKRKPLERFPLSLLFEPELLPEALASRFWFGKENKTRYTMVDS